MVRWHVTFSNFQILIGRVSDCGIEIELQNFYYETIWQCINGYG